MICRFFVSYTALEKDGTQSFGNVDMTLQRPVPLPTMKDITDVQNELVLRNGHAAVVVLNFVRIQ